MPHVVVSGVRLAYHEWPGRGPAVLCIHGITANCHAWDRWAERLAPAYRVIALDLRGRGESDKPPAYPVEAHRDPYCYPRDLDGFLDALGIEGVSYIGHSLGAMIGVLLAVTYPRRVRKLILVDGGHDLRSDVTAGIRPSLERLDITFPSLDDYLARMRALPFFKGTWNRYLDRYFRYDAEVLPDGGARSRVSRAAIEADTETLLPLVLSEYHPKIAPRTLILQAPAGLLAENNAIMSRGEAERMVEAIPDARLVTVNGTNHYTILFGDNPEVLREVKQFLSG